MSEFILNIGFALAYIGTSGTLILYNATILKGVFPYPALLTAGHMLFSGTLSFVLVHTNIAKSILPPDFLTLPAMTKEKYMESIMPIAALQGASLWLSNLAYLYISVSLIQMIKASNTVWTYAWSVPLGLAVWNLGKASNLAVIGGGVAIAAFGAVEGGTFGMLIQLLGIIIEAARLALVQFLFNRRGLKFSPITALYYIAPAVFPLLIITAVIKGELSQLFADGWQFPLWMMLSNMMLAFSLNFIGLLVIKRMSAVAYVLSGICKDILLVSGGALIWGEIVTAQQVFGYGIALIGLAYYNYSAKMASVPPPIVSSKQNTLEMEAGDSDTENPKSLLIQK